MTTFADSPSEQEENVNQKDPKIRNQDKISMLHFKQLSIGAKVLGVIKEVTKRDMVISLPSFLTAFSANATITSSSYRVGDVVLGIISDLQADGHHRRISLDIQNMGKFNGTDILPTEELFPGLPLLGRIKSKEATGYVVDIGIPDVIGFYKTTTFNILSGDYERTRSWVVQRVTPRVILMEPFSLDIPVIAKVKGSLETMSDRSILPGSIYKSIPRAFQEKALFDFPFDPELPNTCCRLVYADVNNEVYMFSRLAHLINVEGSSKGSNTISTTPAKEFFKMGTMVEGAKYIASYGKSGALFSLIPNHSNNIKIFGFAHHSKLDTKQKLRLNGSYLVRIMGFDPFSQCYQVSMNADDLGKRIFTYEDLHPGSIVKAQVVSVKPFGLIVTLIKSELKAIVPIIEMAGKLYQEGDQVRGLILDVDPSTKRVTMTLDAELITKASQIPFQWNDFDKLNQKITGRVVSLQSYGAIVKFGGNDNIKGILLKGEITGDSFVKNVSDHVTLNSVVTCRVLSVDIENHRLQLTLREDNRTSNDNSNVTKKAAKKVKVPKEETRKENESLSIPVPNSSFTMSVLNSSKENDKQQELTSKVELKQDPNQKKRSLEDYLQDDDDDNDDPKTISSKPIIKPLDDNIVVKRDVREEYEKRLLTAPNSSTLWIEYMSALVRLGDLSDCRHICERALTTISYREEQERRNMWIAYLNLECSFFEHTNFKEDGNHHNINQQTLQSLLGDRVYDIFQRACAQTDDPLEITLALGSILQSNKQTDIAHNFYANHVAKKYKQSCKAWLAYLQLLFSTSETNKGEDDESKKTEGRNMLPHIMQCLPKRKHVKFMVQFALIEYRHGSSQRGRLLFEGLLTSYPRRMDVWLVYAAQETKHNHDNINNNNGDDGNSNLLQVRSIYERLLTQSLSMKKAKAVFKEYLDFEKQHGTANTVEHVKDLARAYVEHKTESI